MTTSLREQTSSQLGIAHERMRRHRGRSLPNGPPTPRAALLGHSPAIIWLTGLSGAGKSTLAAGLEQRLLDARILSAVVDGDVLRAGLNKDLGFTLVDRRENVRRAGELALALAQAGLVAIVALISPIRADRTAVAERARRIGLPFAEVFVNAPLAVCERRDPKGLYKRARAGELEFFTGIDSPYEPPVDADLELRTDLEPIEQSAETLVQFGFTFLSPARS